MEIPSEEEAERRVKEVYDEQTDEMLVDKKREFIAQMFQQAGSIVLPGLDRRSEAHIAAKAFSKYRAEYERIDIGVRLRSSLEENESLRKELDLYRSNVSDLLREVGIFSEALETLAKLGNGDRVGNSEGNVIAYQALKKAGYPCPSE